MDEEFKALLEYVEHRLIGKVVMGFKTSWKEKKAQNFEEYIKKKMQDWEAKGLLAWSKLFGMASYVPHYLQCLDSTKCFATIPMGTQQWWQGL